METYPIVYIKWVDAVGDPVNGWKDAEDTNEFFDRDDNVVEEVGFVWSEDEDYLNMFSGWMIGEEPITKHRSKIPKKWILHREELKLKKGKNAKVV